MDSQFELLTRHWALVVAALIGIIGWIVVTLINKSCHHVWEPYGQAGQFKWATGDGAHGHTVRQPVKCSKCGKITHFDLF